MKANKNSNLSALDVANFFINLSCNSEEEEMTNLRLNKILFFAQAWSLVRFNKGLFVEDFHAWSSRASS